ncbi:MAG TPA: hypothetical protein EYH05_17095 [Anaerolineae bacterium]|nr:hypothetical protein [Anaerolineae bacterium]
MAWARDNAAEACQRAIKQLKPLLDSSNMVVVARAARAISEMQLALRNLEYAQASTRPTND